MATAVRVPRCRRRRLRCSRWAVDAGRAADAAAAVTGQGHRSGYGCPAVTVIAMDSTVLDSAAEHVGPTGVQLSGSPRSVTW